MSLREGEDLPVLRGRLRKGQGHKLRASEHMDVWFWVLEAHHQWWPIPQRQGCWPLDPQLGGMFAPSSIRVKIPGNPGTLELGSVAATPAMVLQVRCTRASAGEGWKVGVPRACDGQW